MTDNKITAPRQCRELNLNIDKAFHLAEITQQGFARISTRIEMQWGANELNEYFKSLLIDFRGDRDGFPYAVFSDILALYILHNVFDDTFRVDPWITTHLK